MSKQDRFPDILRLYITGDPDEEVRQTLTSLLRLTLHFNKRKVRLKGARPETKYTPEFEYVASLTGGRLALQITNGYIEDDDIYLKRDLRSNVTVSETQESEISGLAEVSSAPKLTRGTKEAKEKSRSETLLQCETPFSPDESGNPGWELVSYNREMPLRGSLSSEVLAKVTVDSLPCRMEALFKLIELADLHLVMSEDDKKKFEKQFNKNELITYMLLRRKEFFRHLQDYLSRLEICYEQTGEPL
jgi:hypothetical protein